MLLSTMVESCHGTKGKQCGMRGVPFASGPLNKASRSEPVIARFAGHAASFGIGVRRGEKIAGHAVAAASRMRVFALGCRR